MREWITGRNPVYECLRASRRHFFRLLLNEGSEVKGRVAEIVNLARKANIRTEMVDKFQLAKIADNPQGVALQVSGYSYADLHLILDHVDASGQPMFILILDQIQDVQNLGALIRSAEIFGVHGTLIPARRAAGITPAVVNASSGATEHLMIAQINLSQAIDELRERGAWVVGLDMDESAQPLDSINLKGPLVVVVGSEGHGLRRLVRAKCDYIASIPMVGKVASLNASAAGSIALYAALAQRNKLD